jgi:hypothetical protein
MADYPFITMAICLIVLVFAQFVLAMSYSFVAVP